MSDQSGREFEIKLLLPEGQCSASGKLLANASLVRTDELSAIYFDTNDWSLRQVSALLRIRSDGQEIEQTCKFWDGGDGSSRVNREEWSCPLTEPKIDMEAFPSKLQKRIRKFLSGKTLQPYADISTRRTSGLVAFGASLIEVAIDQVTISAAEDKRHFSEIEMELKQGKASDIFRYIMASPVATDMRWSIKSKADRGYELAAGVAEAPQKAGDIQLDPRMSVTQAFRVIAWSCINHLLGNYLLVIGMRDEEALHQSRVAIRRLRSALSIFRDIVDDQLYGQLYEEWRNAAKKMGAARDLDVLIGRVDRDGSEAERIFSDKLADARRQKYDDVCAYLQSPDFQRLLQVTAIWLDEGNWSTKDMDDPSSTKETIGKFARHYFRKKRHALIKRGSNLDKLTAAERHRLRIKIKKLAYALDFFRSLSRLNRPSKVHGKIDSQIDRLKDQLGALNDIATGQNWSTMIGKSEAKPSPGLERGLHEFQLREHDREALLLTKASATLRSLQKSISG